MAVSQAAGRAIVAHLSWTYTGGGSGNNSFPVIDSAGTIYFAGSDGCIHAVLPDGTAKWVKPNQNHGFVPPVVGPDGKLYGGDFQDVFYSLDPADGAVLWSIDYKHYGSGFVNAPIILPDGTIYITSWDGNLYSMSPSGSTLWAFNCPYSFQGTPAVSRDGTVYVMSDKLYAINGSNGREIWDFRPANEGSMPWWFESTPVIGSDGTVYTIGYYTDPLTMGNKFYLFAVDTAGREKWRFKLTDGSAFDPGGRRTMPALQSDGTLIVAVSTDQRLVAVNPDGTKKSELAVSDRLAPDASPSIDGLDRIYVTLRFGITCVDPDVTEQVWTRLVADGSNGVFFESSPTLGQDTVYVTSQKGNYGGELYAIPLCQ